MPGPALASTDLNGVKELLEAIEASRPPSSIEALWERLTDEAKAYIRHTPDLALQVGPMLARAENLELGEHDGEGQAHLVQGGVLAHLHSLERSEATADEVGLSGTRGHLRGEGLGVHELGITDARVRLDDDGLAVDAERVGFMNTRLGEVDARFDREHVSAGAGAKDLQVHDVDVGPSSLRADRSGLRVDAQRVDFTNTRMSDARARIDASSGHHVSASLDEGSFHELHVGRSSLDASRDGLKVRTDGVDFLNSDVENFEASAGSEQTGRGARVSVDEAALHDLSVGKSSFDVSKDGLAVRSEGVDWKNADMKAARAFVGDSKTGDGVRARVSRLEAHDLSAKDLALDSHLLSTRIRADELDYRHARLTDGQASAQLGKAGAQVSVDEATFGEAHVEDASLELDDLLLEGAASARNASWVGHDLAGAKGGVSWGGQALLGGEADLMSAYAAKEATAGWDLSKGAASASVEDFEHERSLNHAHLNVLGHELDVPDLGMKVAADAHAGVDLSKGAVHAGVNLAGSEVAVGDARLRLPEWAQAGFDASVSDRQLNLNIGGHELDVDEMVRNPWNKVTGWFGRGD